MLPNKRQLTKAIKEAVANEKFSAERATDFQLMAYGNSCYLYWPKQGKCAAVRDSFSKGAIRFTVKYPDDVGKGSYLETNFVPLEV